MQVDIDALGDLAGNSLFHVQGTLGWEILKTAQEEQFQKTSVMIPAWFEMVQKMLAMPPCPVAIRS